MKIVGLITEYNPFHNGHKYHIEQALKLTQADAAIVVMSGNHVQRGALAILPKHLRATIALSCGAAAVFELPVCYATGSAEYFALGAVSLLERLGCVDCICFGTETSELSPLKEIARILSDEPEAYRTFLQQALKSGDSYPTARQKALTQFTGSDLDASLLELPNNILGIEYLKALYRLHSDIVPYILPRAGAGYHDLSLDTEYASASAIRNVLSDMTGFESPQLKRLVPEEAYAILTESYGKRYPIIADDYSLLLKYKLLTLDAARLTEYVDVTPDLANRILKCRNQFISFRQFCELLKTKQLTYTRISRALLHILLEIRQTDVDAYRLHGFHGYARLLGFRKDSSSLLSILKEKSAVPLLTKLTAVSSIEEPFQTMLAQDIFASDLYESAITDKFHTPFKNEYEHQIVRF